MLFLWTILFVVIFSVLKHFYWLFLCIWFYLNLCHKISLNTKSIPCFLEILSLSLGKAYLITFPLARDLKKNVETIKNTF